MNFKPTEESISGVVSMLQNRATKARGLAGLPGPFKPSIGQVANPNTPFYARSAEGAATEAVARRDAARALLQGAKPPPNKMSYPAVMQTRVGARNAAAEAQRAIPPSTQTQQAARFVANPPDMSDAERFIGKPKGWATSF